MKGEYTSGLRDGLAIGVGYFSVSFTFGILAVNGGLSPLAAGLISLTNMRMPGKLSRAFPDRRSGSRLRNTGKSAPWTQTPISTSLSEKSRT